MKPSITISLVCALLSCYFAIINSQTPLNLLTWGGSTTFKPTIVSRGVITLMEGKGADHILFVEKVSNSVKLFGVGDNEHSQLGQGTSSPRSITRPVEITGIADVSLLATGREHSMVVTTYGDVYTFGSNSLGQLGVTTISKQDSPTLLSLTLFAGESIISACAGEGSSYLLTSANRLFVFGDNSKGQFCIFFIFCIFIFFELFFKNLQISHRPSFFCFYSNFSYHSQWSSI